ncbi:unnamed protein product [Paramecium octaurelia]|uniref:Transmembrane protein n=1 Tax=Paramecium octaurelia TaxID=43137 RepID=A0A8S1YC95_PAROT|nr:unnamed protein product [Paramecium octaurelia]
MKFIFFLNILLWEIISIETSPKVQTLYYFPGENKYTPQPRYHVPFEQHFIDSQDVQFNVELMQEVKVEKSHLTFISDQTQLYYFKNITSEQDNMMMLLDNSNLYCLYLIKNDFLGEQLVIIPHFCNITLPYQSCSNLLQIKNQILISNCQLNTNQVAISIINFDGKVFDEKLFEIESNCKIKISYGDSILFIYYQNCKSNDVYKMEIDQQSFQYTSFKMYYILQDDGDKVDPTFNQIEEIMICDKQRFTFLYRDKIVCYSSEFWSQARFINENNSTILKSFSFCKGLQYTLYINNYHQQLKFDQFDLNVNYSQYINSFWIEKIIVLHHKDQIIAMINNQLQQKIDISISQLIPIIDSTYIFGLCKGQLRLFKIKPPKHYHSFNVSQKILSLIFSRQNYFYSFTLEQINIEILNQSEPNIIINKQDIAIFRNMIEEVCFEQAQISKNLPINIQALQEGGKYYTANQTEKTETYKVNFDQNSKILHFYKLNDETNVLIMIQSKDIITLMFCKNSKVNQKYRIKVLKDYIDVGVFLGTNILIFNEYCIQYYKIEDSLQILHKEIPQQKRVVQVNLYYTQIFILYDDCSESRLVWDIKDTLIFEDSKQSSFNCTFKQPTNFFSFQNQIIYRLIQIQKFTQGGKVINILEDVEQNLHIVIVEIGNKLELKLYHQVKNDFTFMYNLPTYNFIFELTSTYKLQKGLLMLNAKHQDKTFLLVYQLKNQAFNSLIYITEIDSSFQYFSYYDLDSRTIVFLKDGKFQFNVLNFICMNLNFTSEDSIVQVKQFSLVVKSPIDDLTSSVNMMVFSLQSDYSLSLLNQEIRNIHYQEPLDWDSIKGNIVRFEIQPSQNITLRLPLDITQEYFSCLYFESNVCLIDKYTIEIKSLNVKNRLQLQITDRNITTFAFHQESLTYSIIYLNENTLEQVTVQLNNNNPEEFTLLKKELVQQLNYQVQKIKVIKDFYFLFMQNWQDLIIYYNHCQILGLFKDRFIDYYLFDGAYLTNNTYVFLSWNFSFIEMSIVAISNIQLGSEFQCKWDIIQYHEIKIQNGVEKKYSHYFDKEQWQIQIINLETKGDFLFIKIALIYKYYFTLLQEISFNHISYDNLVVESYRFLRYDFNSVFLDLLYADDNFVVLTLLQNSKEYIHVYDIKVETKYKDYLDSIQRIESFNYKKIEKYNESHYVIYSKNIGAVFFMTLNPFKIECQDQCNETANLILINDVSSLSLKIQFKNSQLSNVEFTIKSEILLANLIFILLFVEFRKKSKRNLNKPLYDSH